MGAGQIGGIATLLDLDFNNAAGFEGVKADSAEGQFVTYYLSHSLLFCMGALIEPHVVLTPAICVFGEKFKFEVFGGSHHFLLNSGAVRHAEHLSFHKAYNHTHRWTDCTPSNMALVLINKPFSFTHLEPNADYVSSRLRYGPNAPILGSCRYFGFGSRRNGFLLPLSIYLRKVEVVILPEERCLPMWNNRNQFLCIQETPCKTEKFGALCPDDVGSVIECSGYAVGMMVSRLVDRPCGTGFLNLQKNLKFLTCGVDNARDIVAYDPYLRFDLDITQKAETTPQVITVPYSLLNQEENIETLVPDLDETSPTTTASTDEPTNPAKMRKGRVRSGIAKNSAMRQRAPGYGTTSGAAGGESNVPVWYSKPQDYYGYL